MRTISVSPSGEGVHDLDGNVVDGLESLRQRVRQAILFRVRSWFLNQSRGVDYSLISGHTTNTQLAAAEFERAILTAGLEEVIRVHDVRFAIDRQSRAYTYFAMIDSIYGRISVQQVIST